VFDAEGYVRLMNLEHKLAEANAEKRRLCLTWRDTRGWRIRSIGWPRSFPWKAIRPNARRPRVRIEPGKEEDFRYLRGWLASSEWLDRLIASTEPEAAAGTDPASSQGLHLTGRALPTAGRRLLEWSGDAAPARFSDS
jgi:hypothetical protein